MPLDEVGDIEDVDVLMNVVLNVLDCRLELIAALDDKSPLLEDPIAVELIAAVDAEDEVEMPASEVLDVPATELLRVVELVLLGLSVLEDGVLEELA